MACAVPCVGTDVGDTGRIVPPRNAASLASAWDEILSLSEDDRRSLGDAARQRIIVRYSLASVVSRYEEIYERFGAAAAH